MPDWTAPFTLPKYTTAEFRALKAAYVAKHGYTITIPGLYDIIKIPIEKPMTEQETKDWKAKRYNQFSENRLYEIKTMKQKRKDKFLAMLASPQPEIVANVGALMTAIDNAQDAIFTLGMMGLAAIRFVPPSVAAVISIPIGVILTASEALSVIQQIGHRRLPSKESKRAWQKKTGIDPWSKKGRIKYAQHLMKTFPKKAALLQVPQVTADIFGVGLSLGPIVGLALDAIAGPIRRIFGDKVTVQLPIPTYDQFCQGAQYRARQTAAYFYPGVQTSDEEVISIMLAQWLNQVAIYSGTRNKPGWENFNDLEDLELMMPLPTNPLTLEVIKEEGIDVKKICGWPHNSKPWAAATDIVEEYAQPAQDYFNEYMARHPKDWIGHIFSTLAGDSTLYTLATAEGENQVEYDYTAMSKTGSILLENRLYPDPDQPAGKVQLLADQIDILEARGIKPTLRDLLEFCENKNIAIIKF